MSILKRIRSITRRFVGRDRMVALSYIAYKRGLPIALPMHAVDPPRNDELFYGEYIRVSSLELVAREINEFGVPGAVAELGVFRGEFAALINRAFPDKRLYLFDTFEGFPAEDLRRDSERSLAKAGPREFKNTSVSLVLEKMKYRDNCIVRKGMFPNTADDCCNETFAFVSLDADLYNPLYEGLRFFYPRLSPGGYIFVHDYNNSNYRGAKEAVRQYCAEQRIGYFPLTDSSGTAIICKPRL